MTKVIINADDFGLSKATNYGIIEAHLNGVLTSTTLMVTMPSVEHAVSLMKFVPDLGVGLHLNITLGQPLTDNETLTNEEGYFIKPQNLNQEYSEEEVYLEFKKQYDKFINLVGEKPSHFDTHLFASDKIETVQKATVRLANEVSVPVRNLDTQSYDRVEFISFRKYGDPIGLDYLFNRYQDFHNYDVVEIMSHPGYIDQYILDISSYNYERLEELDILTSKKLKELFTKEGFELISYHELPRKK